MQPYMLGTVITMITSFFIQHNTDGRPEHTCAAKNPIGLLVGRAETAFEAWLVAAQHSTAQHSTAQHSTAQHEMPWPDVEGGCLPGEYESKHRGDDSAQEDVQQPSIEELHRAVVPRRGIVLHNNIQLSTTLLGILPV